MTPLKNYLDNHPLVNKRADGLYFQNNFSFETFEKQYIEVRQKENRLHSDKEIRLLPKVSTDHPHLEEWLIRKKSTGKLANYLKKTPVENLLEVGCGNGWFTHRLSSQVKVDTCGVDVNELELAQASRLFSNDRTIFLQADVFSDILPMGFFDVIVLASSAQYFPNFSRLIQRMFELGRSTAEVHIIDTPFYHPLQIADAHKRTEDYFAQMGFPAMAANYFHRSISELDNFNWTYLYNPASLQNRVVRKFRRTSPFPWIVVKPA